MESAILSSELYDVMHYMGTKKKKKICQKSTAESYISYIFTRKIPKYLWKW